MTTDKPSTERWRELVPLGVGPDLDLAEQAELDAILAEDAEARAEFAAFDDAMAPLRALRHLDPQPMPAHLADRMTANVMAAITHADTHAFASTGASGDGMPDVGASPIIWLEKLRHPAVAAMLILALGLGLLLLPDRPTPQSPGGGTDGGSIATTTDDTPTPDANATNAGTPGTEIVESGTGTSRPIPTPVALPAELPRNIDGEAVNAVNTRSTLEMGFPYGMRSIDSDREAGRVKFAEARDPFADPNAPAPAQGQGPQFRLPQSDIAPDDANIFGDF